MVKESYVILKLMALYAFLKPILQLSRLKFLIYSPILYTLGAVIARTQTTEISPYPFFQGLVFVLLCHVMTHFYNDYHDYYADLGNLNPSPWTGGSRAIVEGKVSLALCLTLGRVLAFITLIFLYFLPNLTCRVIGFLIIILAIGYSAPPLKLEHRGLGELCVALVLNVLVPMLGYAMQSDASFYNHYLLMLAPLAVIEYARMMVMNMPDRKSDEYAHKKTLIVIIGIEKAVLIHGVLLIFAYTTTLLFINVLPLKILIFIWTTFPLAMWVALRLFRGDLETRERQFFIPFWASTYNGLSATGYLLGVVFEKGCSPYCLELYPIIFYLASLMYFGYKIFYKKYLLMDRAV